jgi:hypothetical protein
MGTSKYLKTRHVIASEAKQSRVFAKNYGRFADAATPVALYAVEVVVPHRYAPRNDIEAIFGGSLKRVLFMGLVLCAMLVVFVPVGAQAQDQDNAKASQDGKGYRIDKPGTITFTVGIKIKGKVEKPQVMIFLPKERPVYNKATFSMSFQDDIMKPLPFDPVAK